MCVYVSLQRERKLRFLLFMMNLYLSVPVFVAICATVTLSTIREYHIVLSTNP